MRRLVLWSGLDAWRAEAAMVELTPDGVRATGTQLGATPIPYRLEYDLDAAEGFVTRSLHVEATGDAWARRLRLSHDGDGGWHAETEGDGHPSLPPAGGDANALEGALDCDLAFSPLTNVMPIRRHGLHEGPDRVEFLVAWVSVPDLGIHPSRQRYEHVRRDPEGAVVRFTELGVTPGFEAELALDPDGLVVLYPDLARRVDPATGLG
jgi:hypothetical protein